MVFRRSRRPDTPETARIEGVRRLVERHDPASSVLEVLDEVEDSVTEAVQDREQLRALVADLDPAEATAALKAALRARPSPTAPDTPQIASLRRRHDTVHGLANRLDEITRGIERTLVDLDTLAAQVAADAIGGSDDDFTGSLLARVNDDLRALSAAHAELDALEEPHRL